MDIIHAERLVTLAKYLATVPPELFNLDVFASGDRIYKEFVEKSGLEIDTDQTCTANQFATINCGSAACALGWAAMIPEFTKAGLFLEVDITPISSWVENSPYELMGLPVYKDEYNNIYKGFMAGATFFDISYGDASFLFDPCQYRDENGVMLRQVVIKDVLSHIITLLNWADFSSSAKKVKRIRAKL